MAMSYFSLWLAVWFHQIAEDIKTHFRIVEGGQVDSRGAHIQQFPDLLLSYLYAFFAKSVITAFLVGILWIKVKPERDVGAA